MSQPEHPLQDLKDALESLPPHDLAAWTAMVERRLTERLRQRQGHPGAAPSAPGREPDEGADTGLIPD